MNQDLRNTIQLLLIIGFGFVVIRTSSSARYWKDYAVLNRTNVHLIHKLNEINKRDIHLARVLLQEGENGIYRNPITGKPFLVSERIKKVSNGFRTATNK